MSEMNTKDYDYLIIGQGLAGSLMAWHLAKQKQNVLVIDNNHTASSSSVAAGIINPITGHRLNLTNEFTNYWRVAKPLYQELERFFDARILHPLNQTRVIKNAGQAEYLTKRLKDPGYASYLEKLEGDAKPLKEKGYGFANIKECWRVDLNLLLLELRNWLIAQNQYIADKIDYSQIEFNNDEVSLTLEKQQQTIRAKGIIFCEGYQAIHNPWLSHLPFKLAKGDIAKLSLKKQKTAQAIEPKNKLLNWGKWLMQDKPDQYLLGSSYQWGDTGLDKSPDELEKLITSLEQNTSYQSISREWTQRLLLQWPRQQRLFDCAFTCCRIIPTHLARRGSISQTLARLMQPVATVMTPYFYVA